MFFDDFNDDAPIVESTATAIPQTDTTVAGAGATAPPTRKFCWKCGGVALGVLVLLWWFFLRKKRG